MQKSETGTGFLSKELKLDTYYLEKYHPERQWADEHNTR